MTLQIRDLRQQYGSLEILNIDSWEIGYGIFWIQGENGAGKSTLFRTIAGMLPYTGSLRLDDRFDLQKDPVEFRLRLNLGEAEPLYPLFLTPADLLEFVAEAKQSPAGQTQMLVEALGINYLQTPFGNCSSGMVKKLSLALAFLGEPSVIILDEPLITIDRDARIALFSLIKSYHAKSVTFLLSSHENFQQDGLDISATYLLKDKTLTLVPAL